MKLFTYQDYLIYEELHGTILKVAESAENYDYGQLEINKYHDKIFKELFSNKKEEQEFLMDIIVNTAKEKINKEKVKELKEKIIGKGGENMVIENLSRIWDMHYERGVNQGKKEGKIAGIKEIVIRMLKNNMKDEVIKKMTNMNDIELEKIKSELKNTEL